MSADKPADDLPAQIMPLAFGAPLHMIFVSGKKCRRRSDHVFNRNRPQQEAQDGIDDLQRSPLMSFMILK